MLGAVGLGLEVTDRASFTASSTSPRQPILINAGTMLIMGPGLKPKLRELELRLAVADRRLRKQRSREWS